MTEEKSEKVFHRVRNFRDLRKVANHPDNERQSLLLISCVREGLDGKKPPTEFYFMKVNVFDETPIMQKLNENCRAFEQGVE